MYCLSLTFFYNYDEPDHTWRSSLIRVVIIHNLLICRCIVGDKVSWYLGKSCIAESVIIVKSKKTFYLNISCTYLRSSGPTPSPVRAVTVFLPPYLANFYNLNKITIYHSMDHFLGGRGRDIERRIPLKFACQPWREINPIATRNLAKDFVKISRKKIIISRKFWLNEIFYLMIGWATIIPAR